MHYFFFKLYFLSYSFLNSVTLPIFYFFRSPKIDVAPNIGIIDFASFLCWFFLMIYIQKSFWISSLIYEILMVYSYENDELAFVECMFSTILESFEVKSIYNGCYSFCFWTNRPELFISSEKKYRKA
jgi:uncharacterized protein YggT (Ycf19 family)